MRTIKLKPLPATITAGNFWNEVQNMPIGAYDATGVLNTNYPDQVTMVIVTKPVGEETRPRVTHLWFHPEGIITGTISSTEPASGVDAHLLLNQVLALAGKEPLV